MDFILQNDLISILTALVTVASIIVDNTDTPKQSSSKWIRVVYKVIETLAFVTNKAKDK